MSDSSDEHSLAGQNITSVPSDFIAEHGEKCTKLDLSGNRIHSGEWLSKLPNLNELILDHNAIEVFKDYPRSHSVETLWINNNNINELKMFLDTIIKTFPNLTYLSMMCNPCVPNMFADDEVEAYQRYRNYTIYRLKKLSFLDACPVEPSERKEAERVGHLLAPARPTTGPGGVGNGKTADFSSTAADGAAAGAGAAAAEPIEEAYSVKALLAQKEAPKTSAFLMKSRARYDGSNSEGNRFITNDEL